MPAKPSFPAILLPRAWPSRVKSAILHAISLAQYVIVYTRSWAVDSTNPRLRMARKYLPPSHQLNRLLGVPSNDRISGRGASARRCPCWGN